MIPAGDRGFTLGDGLFETLLAEDGVLRHADAHLARMRAGAAVLGLPVPDEGLARRLMTEAMAGQDASRLAVRLTYTAGAGGRGLDRPQPLAPLLVATAAASPKPATPARLRTVSVRRNDRSPTSRLKSLAYLDNVLARAEAQAAGADEALMLNTAGEIACAAAANIFWVADGQLFTPALACGVLAGTMRARVLAAAEVQEVRATPDALAAASAVFLTSSLIGLRAVSDLDGRAEAPWPGIEALAARLA